MEQVYYGIAIVVYGIFIIRFLLSLFGGDFELDVDSDISISDVVSFKGLTHFLMGSSGWLSLKSLTTHNIVWYDYIIAIIVGIIFIIILYFVYRLMMSLESKGALLKDKDLEGKAGKVYLNSGKDQEGWYHYIVTVENGNGTTEVDVHSTNGNYKVGDRVILKTFQGDYFII